MKQYHEHLQQILDNGSWKDPAREGMPRSISLFGYQNRYDLQKGFPILTTKKINFKHIVTELLWFLRGDTNIKYLVDNDCNVWNEDAYNFYTKLCKEQSIIHILSFKLFISFIKSCDDLHDLEVNSKKNSMTDVNQNLPCIPRGYILGDCGKQYGWLWRSWGIQGVNDDNAGAEIDQLENLIDGLKLNPEGRRHIITAWNPATLDDMALNACHAFVQFNCRKLSFEDKVRFYSKNISPKQEPTVKELETLVPQYYLDCQMYQRSADMFLGVPYNISSYVLLTHIIAKICNMEVGHFIHSFGDSHIYENHLDQVNELLSRDPEKYSLPFLEFRENLGWKRLGERYDFDVISLNDFTIRGYESYPSIKAPLSTGLK